MEDLRIAVNLLLFRPGIYLEPCLKSILAQSYKNFELLIIDNNSQDGTVGKVRELMAENHAELKWRLLENDENLGYARGHNLGIKKSEGDLVLLVNQDIILDQGFLEQIVGVFADPKVGSVQEKLLRLKIDNENLIKTDIIDTTGLVILKNRRIIARGQGHEDAGQFNRPEEVFGADGALPIYRRAALEEAKIGVGLKDEYFDEDFFMYKEDVDLAWRLQLYGWKAWFEPKAVAWHARTAGDSAQTSYLGIIKERLKINRFGKFHSFKNQRLMQIKNEQPELLLKHLIRWLPKEIASWFYVLLFEHYTWKSIKELLKLAPRAWQKRKIIMAQKTINNKKIEKWFK